MQAIFIELNWFHLKLNKILESVRAEIKRPMLPECGLVDHKRRGFRPDMLHGLYFYCHFPNENRKLDV